MSTPERPELTALSMQLESAHAQAVGAAVAGLQDAALSGARLAGPAVPLLADAAVSSATPFLRAPLLARMSAVLVLHPPAGNDSGYCTTCGTPSPCPTAEVLAW